MQRKNQIFSQDFLSKLFDNRYEIEGTSENSILDLQATFDSSHLLPLVAFSFDIRIFFSVFCSLRSSIHGKMATWYAADALLDWRFEFANKNFMNFY